MAPSAWDRLTPVVHEDRVESGRVECRRNAPRQDDGPGLLVGEADVRSQRDVHQDSGMREHPCHAVALSIVAAVPAKERIVGIGQESVLRIGG